MLVANLNNARTAVARARVSTYYHVAHQIPIGVLLYFLDFGTGSARGGRMAARTVYRRCLMMNPDAWPP